MKSTLALAVCGLLLAGCSDPDSKINADPNNVTNANPNNVTNNTSNNASNNVNNTNGGGDIDPTNYDQSCAVDPDCMLILSGDPCGCGPCLDAAINVSDQTAYQDDKAAGMCAEIACPAIACGDDQRAYCNSGTCDVRVAKYTVADDWDRSCSADEDCVAVYEGEVCDCRACLNTAINVADQADYEAQFDVSCESGLACACAPPEVFCNEGLCDIAR